MINITREKYPTLFENIDDFIIDDSYYESRRGSTFYTKSIVKFDIGVKDNFPEITNFGELVGFWETNQYVTSEDYTDWTDITTLTKVKIFNVVKTVQEYLPVDEEGNKINKDE